MGLGAGLRLCKAGAGEGRCDHSRVNAASAFSAPQALVNLVGASQYSLFFPV